jgi:hypothetical protein
MRQKEREFNHAAPRFNKMELGTVLRHRLFSDQDGRWLEFTLVDGDRRTTYRWRVDGEGSRQLIHGMRYAVMGLCSGDEKRVFEVTRAVGHDAPQTKPCNRLGHRLILLCH